MSRWTVLPHVDPALATHFASLDAVFVLEGQLMAKDSVSRTLRVEVAGRVFFVKRYAGLGKKPLRRLLARPRVQIEWQNLQRFADWGIPTAQLVAYGLDEHGGSFLRGALVTEEIPETTDLARLANQQDPRLKSQPWLNGVIPQVAALTRCLHQHRFAHGDLKWRNLLIDRQDRVHLIDCPSGAFWWPPFLEYRIVKDLACLDKVARHQLSRTWRLRFYLDYAQKKRLDRADKRRLRHVLRFFEGRDEAPDEGPTLRGASRHLPVPFALRLDQEDGEALVIERWLRILPGKRLTGLARWREQTVIAKLFIAPQRAERHAERERRGLEHLQRQGLPGARLLASGALLEGGRYLLSHYLHASRAPDPARVDELLRVFATVGRMHARGLCQADLHLDNFVLQGEQVFIVDGAGIRAAASPRRQRDNLALLFAQLPAEQVSENFAPLLASYRQGHPAATDDAETLHAAIAAARRKRLADYLDKCLRDCTLFKVTRRADRFVSRPQAEAEFLAPLIADPDAWIERGVPLKRGRSATLARVELAGRSLVIKRNNIKHAAHAVSRAWRPSRAWHSWVEAHRLEFLGIATPRPLALIERRRGPLRGQAWYVSEYCPGPNLREALRAQADGPPAEELLQAIRTLFGRLAEARISHGDLKADNFIYRDGRLWVLDLDAVRQHDSRAAWQRAWQRDRDRFLRNWPEDSPLRQILAEVVDAAVAAV